MWNIQWWCVTKYIYSRTLLKHCFKICVPLAAEGGKVANFKLIIFSDIHIKKKTPILDMEKS